MNAETVVFRIVTCPFDGCLSPFARCREAYIGIVPTVLPTDVCDYYYWSLAGDFGQI